LENPGWIFKKEFFFMDVPQQKKKKEKNEGLVL
jgi:hypothetical protein